VPLVAVARRRRLGRRRGAHADGREVLARYTRMEKACRTATRRDWQTLTRLLPLSSPCASGANTPSLKIRARSPPRPRNQASAPDANTVSIQ